MKQINRDSRFTTSEIHWFLVLILPLLVLASCDSSADMYGAADDLDGTSPPPVSSLEGPALFEPAPAPCIEKMGPNTIKSADKMTTAGSSLNQEGLPSGENCIGGNMSMNLKNMNAGELFSPVPDTFFFSKLLSETDERLDIISHSQSIPGAAILNSPSGTVNTASPRFEWQPVSGATWYYVWVRDSETMVSGGSPRISHWITANDAGCGGGSGTCRWNADKNLESGNARWWIQTYGAGGYGPWSDAMNFTVPENINLPATALLVSPDSQTDAATPTFQWQAVSEATWYYVWVRDSDTMSGSPRYKKWITSNQAGCSSGSGTCSWTINEDLTEGNAIWWIQTWNNRGYGQWSSGMSFSVLDAAPPVAANLNSPEGVMNDVRPLFEWDAVPNSSWYRVWVRDSQTMSGDPRIDQWITAEQAGCASGTGTCSWQADTDLYPGEAKFWIRTWNDVDAGPWSDAMDFHYEMVFAGVVGPNNAVENSPRPVFEWTAVKNIESYQIGIEDSHDVSFNKFITPAEANCESGTGTCTWESDTDLGSGIVEWGILTYFQDHGGPGFNADTFLGSFSINLFDNCGDVLTDISGRSYETVQIGGQCWMAENLRATRYRNGVTIAYVSNNNQWANLTTGAWAYYENNTSNADGLGKLYNWFTVDDSRGVCPMGWEVPTESEWRELELHLGMPESDLDQEGWDRGIEENVGYKMRTDGVMNIGWYGSNESGFSAVDGGFRFDDGEFCCGLFPPGAFWSVTQESANDVWSRSLWYNTTGVQRETLDKKSGLSIRCILD